MVSNPAFRVVDGPDAPAAAIPEELRELPLYAADPELCRRWPAVFASLKRQFAGRDILAEITRAHDFETSNGARPDRPAFLWGWLRRERDPIFLEEEDDVDDGPGVDCFCGLRMEMPLPLQHLADHLVVGAGGRDNALAALVEVVAMLKPSREELRSIGERIRERLTETD